MILNIFTIATESLVVGLGLKQEITSAHEVEFKVHVLNNVEKPACGNANLLIKTGLIPPSILLKKLKKTTSRAELSNIII